MSKQAQQSPARSPRASTAERIKSLEAFARHYRLKLAEEPCGAPIIPGYRGSHLYWDRGALCWMVEGPVKLAKRVGNLLRSAASKYWIGECAQDLDCRGIPPNLYRKIITLSGAKKERYA